MRSPARMPARHAGEPGSTAMTSRAPPSGICTPYVPAVQCTEKPPKYGGMNVIRTASVITMTRARDTAAVKTFVTASCFKERKQACLLPNPFHKP